MKYALIILLISGETYSQNCESIEDNLARLDCYDNNKNVDKIDDVTTKLRDVMVQQLKNPSSAQFRNETIYTNELLSDNVLCGELNAHNSYGAYTGFKPFISFNNTAISIDSDNRGYVGLYCKNVTSSDYPEATIKASDSYIELARTMVDLQLPIHDLALYKDEKLVPLGDYNAVCGMVNFPMLKNGYVGYRKYLMTGVSTLIHKPGEESKTYDKIYGSFCGDKNNHVKTFDQWYLMSDGNSNKVVSIQNNSALTIGCENNKPTAEIYSSNYVSSYDNQWENKSVGQKYHIISLDNYSIAINLNKKNGRVFLKNFVMNPITELKAGYGNVIVFNTSGMADAINEFKKGCDGFKWDKYWN